MERLICIIEEDKCRQFRRELECELHELKEAVLLCDAEDDIPMMKRTIDGFQGFLDCLEGATVKGVVYGVGAWKIGESEGKPSMAEAYDMGCKA